MELSIEKRKIIFNFPNKNALKDQRPEFGNIADIPIHGKPLGDLL